MTITELIKYRLTNQQLSNQEFTDPGRLVANFGAMQAQDYAMAKWAVGIRTGATEKVVEHAINSGKIIRTHILRPTWHLVAAEDVRWMLPVSAARIKAACASAWRMLGLDGKVLTHCNRIIEKSLATHEYLTRDELMQELNKKKIATDGLRSIHIMMNAELDAIACNGPMRGKQFTYALLEERIPPTKALAEGEALALLAQKYFTSHGPATLHDFSWWAGITLAQAKAGLESIRDDFLSEDIDGKTYWFGSNIPSGGKASKGIYFLPAFDEFMVSYKDRSSSLDASFVGQTITGNGIFRPIIVVDGKVAGIWKRAIKKDAVVIEMQHFDMPGKREAEIKNAAGKYGNFLEKKVEFTS